MAAAGHELGPEGGWGRGINSRNFLSVRTPQNNGNRGNAAPKPSRPRRGAGCARLGSRGGRGARMPPRCPARRHSLVLGWQPCGSRRPTNCRASSGPDPRGGRAAETRTPAPRCQSRARPGAHSNIQCPTPTSAPVPRPRRRRPPGPRVPAALRATRGSTPGEPRTAPVMTATATQNARTLAGAPIAGAGGAASSGGARQHAAPHGPALAPAGGGRRCGVCGRKQATR